MVITAEDVKILDKNCEELGISTIQLMENAGSCAARIILEKYPNAKTIAVFCGTGNNGGDGFVIVRHLAARNKNLLIFLIGNESKIRSKAALQNYLILKQLEYSVEIIIIDDSTKLTPYKNKVLEADLIIDALLGVGVTSEPYEPIRSTIKMINEVKKPTISVDIPSGLFSDIPQLTKCMIKADTIITFHDIKPCLTVDVLREKTVICNIGIPLEAMKFVGIGNLFMAIPKRVDTSHKGENGTVLVVGGSSKYSGAPLLTSRAALRTGADLVFTCIPSVIATTARSDSPNLIIRSFEGDYFTKKHTPEILTILNNFDSIVLGPGLGNTPETIEFIIDLLMAVPNKKPIIIDADAFKAIATNLSILKNINTILTPHKGEFKLLFGEGLPDNFRKQSEIVLEKAQKNSTIILLKGRYDIISDGKEVKINRTGHEGMTVGGTGDVLAGVLGAIVAINKNYFNATCSAAYLTGKAGELAAEDFGNSLLATDVVEKIPEVLINLH